MNPSGTYEQNLRKALNAYIVGPHKALFSYAEECLSTNDLVAEATLNPQAPPIVIATTNHQRHGRGRGSNRWLSISGKDIALSIAFRAKYFGYKISTRYALASACLTCRAIQKVCNLSLQTKWPNDLIFRGKKLGGILILNLSNYLVTGIGINVNSSAEEFPEEIRDIVITLKDILGKEIERVELIREIVGNFYRFFYEQGKEEEGLLKEWIVRAEIIGKLVKVRTNEGVRIDVKVADVDRKTGELICVDSDGRQIRISTVDSVSF